MKKTYLVAPQWHEPRYGRRVGVDVSDIVPKPNDDISKGLLRDFMDAVNILYVKLASVSQYRFVILV
jgi:hypothetical protein